MSKKKRTPAKPSLEGTEKNTTGKSNSSNDSFLEIALRNWKEQIDRCKRLSKENERLCRENNRLHTENEKLRPSLKMAFFSCN